jgi:50S ribosomal subunit-associated GTPase HflX
LRDRLREQGVARWKRVKVTLPFSDGALVQRVRERGALRAADYSERGIEIDADVPADLAQDLLSRKLVSSARR